ncbi:MAG: hypothetical protein QM784_37310 [Polyangiaceae bacterium]
MAQCEVIQKCIFFHDKMANMPDVASAMKRRLCQTDNAKCARWLVRTKLGPNSVPPDLFPNQIDRANKLIADAGR